MLTLFAPSVKVIEMLGFIGQGINKNGFAEQRTHFFVFMMFL